MWRATTVLAILLSLCAIGLHFLNNAHPETPAIERRLVGIDARLLDVSQALWNIEDSQLLTLDLWGGWSAWTVEPPVPTDDFGPDGWSINISRSAWLDDVENRYDLDSNGDVVKIIVALTSRIDILETTAMQMLLDRIKKLEAR